MPFCLSFSNTAKPSPDRADNSRKRRASPLACDGYARSPLLQVWEQPHDNSRRHLVLQSKNIFKRSVESFRPQMRAGRGVDQLSGNADSSCRLAYAALEHITDT